ncbi:MAG: flagellar basal body rod protein FlgC [SAR86 cluster bacterium]|uniref:Flagellar basal-body rod protein FlgC n=1 Tax=SAR86 cluster bacterium TaxID=2030880 RepID=A0A2A5B5Q0_9GAMM|nr:MAG: flagellar basal body rod protein FlgC [SAR86 cluster bacterium]
MSNVFKITGTALNAQSIHIDLIAKNMASSQIISGTEQGAYRARRPIFASMLESGFSGSSRNGSNIGGVKVAGFSRSNSPIEKQRLPENPFADAEGYVYLSNVNMVEEMAFMMQASRNYQSNIEVLNTSKELMLRTLSLGNS